MFNSRRVSKIFKNSSLSSKKETTFVIFRHFNPRHLKPSPCAPYHKPHKRLPRRPSSPKKIILFSIVNRIFDFPPLSFENNFNLFHQWLRLLCFCPPSFHSFPFFLWFLFSLRIIFYTRERKVYFLLLMERVGWENYDKKLQPGGGCVTGVTCKVSWEPKLIRWWRVEVAICLKFYVPKKIARKTPHKPPPRRWKTIRQESGRNYLENSFHANDEECIKSSESDLQCNFKCFSVPSSCYQKEKCRTEWRK